MDKNIKQNNDLRDMDVMISVLFSKSDQPENKRLPGSALTPLTDT